MTTADHGRSDSELRLWAREHLVYEARMFAYAAVELGELADQPRSHRSNSLLECFAVHTRCLRDFFWHDRKKSKPQDAFAHDFCDVGVWNSHRGEIPPRLQAINDRKRLGREVMHLTYYRAGISADVKDWPIGAIVQEVVEATGTFVGVALPSRLDQETAQALESLTEPLPSGVGPFSVATGLHPGPGGLVSLEDFEVGS